MKKQWVGVLGITADGKPKFVLNALQWTTSLEDAPKFESLAIAKYEIKALKQSYGIVAALLQVDQGGEQE